MLLNLTPHVFDPVGQDAWITVPPPLVSDGEHSPCLVSDGLQYVSARPVSGARWTSSVHDIKVCLAVCLLIRFVDSALEHALQMTNRLWAFLNHCCHWCWYKCLFVLPFSLVFFCNANDIISGTVILGWFSTNWPLGRNRSCVLSWIKHLNMFDLIDQIVWFEVHSRFN